MKLKLIDKSALVAELERIEHETNYEPFTDEVLGKRCVCRSLLSFLNTLEVKEVKKIEQNPAWSEEDSFRTETLISVIKSGGSIRPELRNEFVNWLKSLKGRGQPKQEWNEEGEKERRHCIDLLNHPDMIRVTPTIAKGCKDWLKSLKGRGQPKQEWNEEDINMIDWLIRCCEEEHKELCNDKYGHQDIVSDLKSDCRKKLDWLESLKNRVAPLNTWKPSDVQMDALAWALSLAKNCGEECAFDLRTLYEQLKKLKED